MHYGLNYERVLEVLRKISNQILVPHQGRVPKLKDLELISLELPITCRIMVIDSKNYLFCHLINTIGRKIERTIYNLRKRRLGNEINDLRMKIVQDFSQFEDAFIIEVCKFSRSSISKICKENEYSYPNRGYCASQQMHFYGYKLHAVCSVKDIFQSAELSPTSVYDIHYLKDIRE